MPQRRSATTVFSGWPDVGSPQRASRTGRRRSGSNGSAAVCSPAASTPATRSSPVCVNANPAMGRLLAIRPDAGLTDALQSGLAGHDLESCGGDVEAVVRLRDRAFDVVLTDPATSVSEDLALAAEMRAVRPGVRIIVLTPAATHDDLVNGLRAHVFACFTQPLDRPEIVAMAHAALEAHEWG